jgi:Ca-activated chloride channel homolog
MKGKLKIRIFLLVLFLVPVTAAELYSQAEPKYVPPETRILFIFDGSQSMLGFWGKDRKITIARDVLIHFVDSLENMSNVEMALRVYGFQSPVPPQDCNDTKLVVPFGKNNASKIRQELRFINPKGTTPIAHSLELGGKDFPPGPDNCRNIIVLITDGIEACDGDACAVSEELQKKGIALKPFVIGIGIDENFRKTFDCIGNFYNTNDEQKLKEVMGAVISQALNATTAQVNLLDANGNPTETNVNMTFYDQKSGKVLYNFIHTINNRGNPDTLILDHLVTYRMRVHTLPPVDVNNIKLTVGKHNIIAADTPQGTLHVLVDGSNQYRNLVFIVRQAGKMKTLNIQKVNEDEKYLVGKYDIEVPVLPRLYINNIDVKQSYTTTVKIPRPGILTLQKASGGYGSIYVRRNNTEEWIYNINNDIKNESILLQPGFYRVVYRAKNTHQTLYTISKTFEIRSGSSVPIQLY